MAKKKIKRFVPPIIGIEKIQGITVYYNETGDYSVTMNFENPIVEYSSNSENYYDFHDLFVNILKILGSGYCIQKHDIFSRNEYIPNEQRINDYLSQKYFEHFKGRKYIKQETYLTITKEISRSKNKLFVYNPREFQYFLNNIEKIVDLIHNKHIKATLLGEKEIDKLLMRYTAVNFKDKIFSFDNYNVKKEYIETGDKIVKCLSLVDIDEVNFPPVIRPFKQVNIGIGYPTDILSFLNSVPDVDEIIYTQTIIVPSQTAEINKLEAKKKKHSSMPDPANQLSVQDIDIVLEDIVKNNQLLVYVNYNLIVKAQGEYNLNKALNYIEGKLYDINLVPSKQCNNQLELLRTSTPGNAFELAEYDRFLTSSDAAICLFYKERPEVTEQSPFLTYFADRHGIPIGIDISGKEGEKKLTNNSNFFVLGPSGSGKSFYVNSIIRQWVLDKTDIVMVDTGHSYSGLCDYYNGKYITYTEEKPITMNPFKIEKEEYNEEKRDFLKSLIILLWKGANGKIEKVEDSLLTEVITKYYNAYWNPNENDINKVEKLNFNSFYEFSLTEIERIQRENNLTFNLIEYRYVLKAFYQGGQYEKILNENVDSTLFNETFIVFEIDSIKENKILFPIVTLIIMDIFIQKMRLKKNRKALIIEEAWKAIASPTMANYILYLYKTVRKFWGMAMVVTQDLDDIISNEIVKGAILSNSDIVCLLDQSKFKNNYDAVAALLSISEVERRKIFTINKLPNKENRSRFNEVYVKRGSEGKVYGVEVSTFEYFTFTTERIEKDALGYYQCVYGDYKSSLNIFIQDMKESGLTQGEWVRKVFSVLKGKKQEELHSLKKQYPKSLKSYIIDN